MRPDYRRYENDDSDWPFDIWSYETFRCDMLGEALREPLDFWEELEKKAKMNQASHQNEEKVETLCNEN